MTLLLDSTQLEVVLSATERALAFRSQAVRIERTRIRRVQLTDDAWNWLRGVRTRGSHVPGVLAMGTWKAAGGSDFVLVRRHKPAVVIDLDQEAEFQRVILSSRHGTALQQALRLEVEDELADVVDLATGAIATQPTPTQSPA